MEHNAEWYASQLEAFRRNVARYLAHSYILDPSDIGEICDTQLDKSGILLGYVREEAKLLYPTK